MLSKLVVSLGVGKSRYNLYKLKFMFQSQLYRIELGIVNQRSSFEPLSPFSLVQANSTFTKAQRHTHSEIHIDRLFFHNNSIELPTNLLSKIILFTYFK